MSPAGLWAGGALAEGAGVSLLGQAPAQAPAPSRALPARWLRRFPWPELGFAFAVYAGSRLLLFVLSLVLSALDANSLSQQASNWDGQWYIALASRGYPHHSSHAETTLGFFPLYPMAMWLVGHLFSSSMLVAGVVVSMVGGLVATVLVQRLAILWWGPAAGRRAAVLFCLFPGSVVFSMDYSEGLALPLAAGCLLALQRRRFVLAGVLAGLATAAGPDSLALIAAGAAAFALELSRRGWRSHEAWRAVAAPVLAPAGIVGFGAFLWAWTGTPLASYTAQRYGWGERSDPLATWHRITDLAQGRQLDVATGKMLHGLDLNLVAALAGTAFFVFALVLLVRHRGWPGWPALIFTLGIGVLGLVSENTPLNPRLLITAFPAVVVLARYVRRTTPFALLSATSAGLLVLSAAFTLAAGGGLRP
jgi:hypothetical protein